MVVLSEAERDICRVGFSYDKLVGDHGLTKADIKAAVDAVDVWIQDNKGSFNAALPQPFKGTASTPQKALLMVIVASRRFLGGI